jgi:hypothetical protein
MLKEAKSIVSLRLAGPVNTSARAGGGPVCLRPSAPGLRGSPVSPPGSASGPPARPAGRRSLELVAHRAPRIPAESHARGDFARLLDGPSGP